LVFTARNLGDKGTNDFQVRSTIAQAFRLAKLSVNDNVGVGVGLGALVNKEIFANQTELLEEEPEGYAPAIT
jgi:hypothetical protein